MTQLQRVPVAGAKHHATVLIASADPSFRHKVGHVLEGMLWRVQQAAGGAEALVYLDANDCEALILDSWLPDLEVSEVISECRHNYPRTDLLTQGMSMTDLASVKSSRRQELWYALGRACDDDAQREETPGDRTLRSGDPMLREDTPREAIANASRERTEASPKLGANSDERPDTKEPGLEANGVPHSKPQPEERRAVGAAGEAPGGPRDMAMKLPEIVGSSPAILELCREIRLVAPKKTTVLIEGPTGTGKELVARAVHRLSKRSRNPFIVLNCAAIPEALFEAELFGHTKGAFTGALQSRLGRFEAANGGTLFLDEIGEMPLAFQVKLLRFLERGEIHRIGDNEPIEVDVRVIAATHQRLEKRVKEGSFRADLYFRLAVFPLVTPSLAERREDISELIEHFLRRFAADEPAKSLDRSALERLMAHSWPGGVRELEHVLERGYILGEGRPEITAAEIRFGTGR